MTNYFMHIFLFFFYFLSIFIFLNSSSSLLTWVTMEVNLISFLSLIVAETFYSESLKTGCSLYYFMIQSIGSFLFLFALVLDSASMNSLVGLIFVLSLCLKAGIFPFTFWMFKMVPNLMNLSAVMLLSIQKIPLFIFMFDFFSLQVPFFLVLSLFLGTFFLISSSTFIFMMVSSSICSALWIFYIYLGSIYMYFFFFLAYFLSLSLIFWFFSLNESFEGLMKFSLIFCVLFFLGIPPSSFFYFKVFSMEFIYYLENFQDFMVLWTCSFLCLFGYMKNFFPSFFLESLIYKTFGSYQLLFLSSSIFSLFSFLFFFC